jgi:hypothetical protein
LSTLHRRQKILKSTVTMLGTKTTREHHPSASEVLSLLNYRAREEAFGNMASGGCSRRGFGIRISKLNHLRPNAAAVLVVATARSGELTSRVIVVNNERATPVPASSVAPAVAVVITSHQTHDKRHER